MAANGTSETSKPKLRYLHTMVRVADLDASLDFYVNKLGLKIVRESRRPEHKYDLVFLAPEGQEDAQIELTYNYPDPEPERYTEGRNFGHLAYSVANIYETCQKLMDAGVTINRPPRDGKMAFVRSPDNISIELLQDGPPLAPAEPWKSMGNTGKW
ncbi:glyoxalase/bleomycin resistance protein/dioxygenase [Hyaloraphidium curvatum]|nr:glyoxalase/bleomycin resistance protein/dioxygenase [Hyaloraphidium curvatum]